MFIQDDGIKEIRKEGLKNIKLSISNIAWPAESNSEMLAMVKRLGCDAIEVAPSRVWKEPADVSRKEAENFLGLVNRAGLSVISFHSLLYSRKDLGLFRESSIEKEGAAYLEQLIHLASWLGAKILVFGSPSNRKKGNIPLNEAFARAADFFAKPAHLAASLGVCIAIEPLSEKETEFITDTSQGLHLVNMICSPGFGLHLDAKSIAEEPAPPKDIFEKMAPLAKHFHINDPGLVEIGSVARYHEAFGAALREAGYAGYASIEMKTLPDFRNVVERSINFAKKCYT